MYIVIYGFVYLIPLVITYYQFRTLKKVPVIFSTLWCTCACLSSFGLLGMRKPGIVVHAMTMVLVLVFTFSYIIMSKFLKKESCKNSAYSPQYTINYKLIYIINLITLMLYIPYFIDAVIFYARGYSMGDVRYMALVKSDYSYYHKFFFRALPSAINDSIIIFALIDKLVLKSKKKGLLIFALLDVGMSVFIFGGRFILVKLIFVTLALYTIDGLKVEKLGKKFVVIGLILLICITFIRTDGQNRIWDMFALYYPGAFSFLDLII